MTELVGRLRQPFVLLAPTGQHFDVGCQSLLAGVRAGFVELESNLVVMPSGLLVPQKSGGELFSGYLPKRPDAIRESEAQRIFSIMTRLRAEPKELKAPVHTVFAFTVLDRLSQRETAKRCKCVEGLISKRVKAIEKAFGLSIKQLQDYASELMEMSASVKGDRRRKKHEGMQFTPDEEDPDAEEKGSWEEPSSDEEEDYG